MSRMLTGLASGGALVFAPVVAEAQYYGGQGYGHMWGNGWHGWLFGPMMMIVFVAVIVVVVVLVSRWFGGSGHGKAHGHAAAGRDRTPLDILQTRFARGEIDKDEFAERKRPLTD